MAYAWCLLAYALAYAQNYLPVRLCAPAKSIQLRAGGDVGIDHQKVELLLLAFLVDGGEQHAAGLDAHHGSGGQVGDGDAGLPYQLLGLIILMNAAQNHPVFAGSVVQNELQELLGLLHGLALQHLDGAEIGLTEGLEIDEIREQGLDFHIGKVDGGFRRLRADVGIGPTGCASLPAGAASSAFFGRSRGFIVGY